MATERPSIVVVGSLNVDYTLRVSRLPVPGETLNSRSMLTCFGGKGANQAVAAARAAVNAMHYPPIGDREMSRPMRLRGLTASQYLEWSQTQLLLSCQIEGAEGLENYKEIVKVKGVDCIQTGRNDISQALGVPGENLHPKVLEAEKRIVSAALDAGKQVSLVHSLNADGLERAARWMEQGVRIMTIDSDYMVLLESYKGAVKKLRPS
jgi:2-keto-3-deoxy-L-rhamnonate aldolase RhmA